MEQPGATPKLRSTTPPARTTAEIATVVAKRGSRIVGAVASGGAARVRGQVLRALAKRKVSTFAQPLRLCLGSGHAPIPGWVNVDFEPPADLLVDLRFGMPLQDGSVTAIYSEHLVEHLTLEAALAMFREWHRVLAPDGVVRVATPDLAHIIAEYGSRDWRSGQDWLTWPEHAYIDTPVRMINTAVRAWGHQYLYDFDELTMRLRSAGFVDIRRAGIGESELPSLCGLETRSDSRLVVEARK